VFAYELARRYGDQGIVSTALNPGNLKTNLWQNLSSIRQRIIVSVHFRYNPHTKH
jgi:retinol dehydrogenase 12